MRGILLMLALVAPVAMAAPTSWYHDESTWEEVYFGIATQGSTDDFRDWWGNEIECTQSRISIWMELRLLAGTDDLLTLEAPNSDVVVGQPLATGHAPALVHAQQSDGCPDFVVHGTDVADAVPYELRISHMPGLCIPLPCLAGGPTNTLGRVVEDLA